MKKTILAAVFAIMSISAAQATQATDLRIAVSPSIANVPVATAVRVTPELKSAVKFVPLTYQTEIMKTMAAGKADCAVLTSENAVLLLGRSNGDTRTVMSLVEEKKDNQLYSLTCTSAAQKNHPEAFKTLTEAVAVALGRLNIVKFNEVRALSIAHNTLETAHLPMDDVTDLGAQILSTTLKKDDKTDGVQWASGKVFW